MELDNEYTNEYINLRENTEYKQYIDNIENFKKYIDEEVVNPLKMMVVNASRNQGQYKTKILNILEKKLQQIGAEVENARRTIGAIYRVDENEEYGGKKRRKRRVKKTRKPKKGGRKTHRRRKY
jgi:hypothetical protein